LTGRIYLIPTPIAENSEEQLARISGQILSGLNLFFVENLKVSRRFIKNQLPDAVIDSLEFVEIGKHAEREEWQKAFEKIWTGTNAGLMSDAGCPGIGDPGYQIVREAHNSGVQVVPLTGPNSFILALMASGLNGQSFRFHGYLPIDKSQRKKKIRQMSSDALKTGESQIFMDTPYRNTALYQDLLRDCNGELLLCIASDIQGSKESILTQRISDWRRMQKNLPKVPTVFIIGT
jgi:16S rRNA (cytidine1402-2'-O)-methyltransferase